MRQIGKIESAEQAARFLGFLDIRGIPAQLDSAPDGIRIWVKDEDRLEESRQALTRFLADPSASEFKVAPKPRESEQRTRSPRTVGSRPIDVRREIWNRGMARRTPVASMLIAISILVALVSNLGTDRYGLAMQSLSFYNPSHITSPQWNDAYGPWSDILRGQIWRLLTPIFIHFGITHVLFNMLMVASLGTSLETRQGSQRLAWIVLVAGVLGNVGQIFLDPSLGGYGGMSGVVYGLAGFMWIRGIRAPEEGPALSKESLFFLTFWLVLGFAGVLDQPASNARMANWAHLFGFLGGILVAWMLPVRRRFQTQI